MFPVRSSPQRLFLVKINIKAADTNKMKNLRSFSCKKTDILIGFSVVKKTCRIHM